VLIKNIFKELKDIARFFLIALWVLGTPIGVVLVATFCKDWPWYFCILAFVLACMPFTTLIVSMGEHLGKEKEFF